MACAARNARQVRPDRRGTGSTPVSWRICHTVDGATLYPKPASSPWMRLQSRPGCPAPSPASTPVSSARFWTARECAADSPSAAGPRPMCPAQRRPWGDDLAQLAEMTAGQRPDRRGRERPVARDPAAAARFWSKCIAAPASFAQHRGQSARRIIRAMIVARVAREPHANAPAKALHPDAAGPCAATGPAALPADRTAAPPAAARRSVAAGPAWGAGRAPVGQRRSPEPQAQTRYPGTATQKNHNGYDPAPCSQVPVTVMTASLTMVTPKQAVIPAPSPSAGPSTSQRGTPRPASSGTHPGNTRPQR